MQRIGRLGQTRKVFILSLVAAGTIEDFVLRILNERLDMFELRGRQRSGAFSAK